MVTAIWTTWMFLDISREIAWKFPAFCYTYFLGKCFLKIFLAKQGNDFRKISWEKICTNRITQRADFVRKGYNHGKKKEHSVLGA